MSLLTLFRPPIYALWKPAIAATEWGHWLSVFSWMLAIGGGLGLGLRWSALPALTAAILFITPYIRAMVLVRELPDRMDRAFGPARWKRTEGRIYGGGGRIVPLLFRRLPHLPIPPVNSVSLVYGEFDGVPLTLDLYTPRLKVEPPHRRSDLILVIHGGSWCSGDSTQLSGMNRFLAARGHAVAAINYRLAPQHHYPAPIEDIDRAVEFLGSIQEEFGFDASRLVILGRSSGGHLALSWAYDSERPWADAVRAVVALYPPTDLIWSWARPSPRRMHDSNLVMRQFLGGTPDQVGRLYREASPLLQVSGQSPPTLLIHGANDELVSPLQSTRLATELEAAGVAHLHVEFGWGHHGMDANLAGPSGQITLYLIERFLASALLED
jgi:acetyl esterase/lipase